MKVYSATTPPLPLHNYSTGYKTPFSCKKVSNFLKVRITQELLIRKLQKMDTNKIKYNTNIFNISLSLNEIKKTGEEKFS